MQGLQAGVPAEVVVTRIWSEILKTENIDVQDDFFDLGGTSLGLISVVMRMSEQFGVPLDTGIVTNGATVAALAKSVNERLSVAASNGKKEKA